jgi:hypothetical protein
MTSVPTRQAYDYPEGDLSRTVSHEPNREWPHEIAIVATWASVDRRGKVRRRSRKVVITRDEFFGLRAGAPMSGDQLIYAINRLRKAGPDR